MVIISSTVEKVDTFLLVTGRMFSECEREINNRTTEENEVDEMLCIEEVFWTAI